MYNAITFSVYYPNSTRHTSLNIPSSQYSNVLCYKIYSGLLLYSSCCVFYSLATCTAFFSSLLLGQSLYWCSFSPHSKHFIFLSYAFLYIKDASSFHCFSFCGMATFATRSSLFLGHSLHQCPSLLYLKHCTAFPSFFSSFCFLISTPHLITLLDSTLNLFWGTDVPFPSSFLFLQL